MRLRLGRKGPRQERSPSTPKPEGRDAQKMTAKMQFYAVHNVGEQLRWSSARRTGKSPDRMVGR
jgi:hypothetical protein